MSGRRCRSQRNMLEEGRVIKVQSQFLALIRPGVGVGEIRFGSSKADVISALGKPLEERTDEEGDELLKYPHLGIAFFAFDSSEEMRLTSYELSDQSDAELWGYKIFQCPRKEMSHRIHSAGFILEKAALGDSEDEVLYRVKPLSLDFYYCGQRLEALTAGVIFTDENTIRWPFEKE